MRKRREKIRTQERPGRKRKIRKRRKTGGKRIERSKTKSLYSCVIYRVSPVQWLRKIVSHFL